MLSREEEVSGRKISMNLQKLKKKEKLIRIQLILLDISLAGEFLQIQDKHFIYKHDCI